MSGSTEEGYEDVAVFLQRIKELGDKRDQEDRDRTKKLEEQILQDRIERQVRRAERARSISPTKSSPSNTPTASKAPAALPSRLSQALSPKLDYSRAAESQCDADNANTMEHLTSSGGLKENSAPYDVEQTELDIASQKRTSISSPSAAMPSSRNPPLAWQRRPTSQSSDRPRSRPLSMVATENAARSPRATPAPEFAAASAAEALPSREDIAQSLASKDPSWFRQTPDRGLTSPAYRRNQVEDNERLDHGSSISRVQMPGMSREVQESAKDEQSSRSPSPSRTSTIMDSGSVRSTNVTSNRDSPMLLNAAQRLDPPNTSYATEVRMSPSQGRISPERPDRSVSPTKGMGGFVQSAMMKRSDSVQKRWSVQSPTGLSRGNSVASNRSSQDLSGGIAPSGMSIAPARDVTTSSGRNSRPSSRPTSSHSYNTVTQERPGTSGSIKSNIASTTNDSLALSTVSPSETPNLSSKSGTFEDSTEAVTTPPASPSKADSRRWSPTKSSWLESALNKPESPKPKAVPPPSQPAWMSELTKTKKGSVDLGRNSPKIPKHEVNIGGLLRSPPPGGAAKPPSLVGRSFRSLSGESSKGPIEITLDTKQSPAAENKTADASPPKVVSSAAVSPKSLKTKPETPPKKDWRSGLKSRQTPGDSSSTEPEFKNVFGQLRKTKTQNYVAPDELKDNITRGKAALNITGGPKVTERRDEFKEAILKKKEDFKKAQLEGTGVKRSSVTSTQGSTLPEALAIRNSMRKPEPSTKDKEPITEKRSPARVVRDAPPPSLPFKESSAPGRLQTKEVGVGKLADRLNPALSGLLARGPPSTASDTSRSSSPSLSQRPVTMSTSTEKADNAEGGPQLTHMTKGRARGPRRKAPSALTATTAEPKSDDTHATIESKSKNVTAEPSPLPSASKSPVKISRLAEMPPPLKPIQAAEQASSPTESGTPIQPSPPRKLDIKRRSQFLQEAPSKATQVEPQLDTPKPLFPTQKANPVEISVKPQNASPKSPPLSSKSKPSPPFKSPALISPKPDKSPTSPTKSVASLTTTTQPLADETNSANFQSTSKQGATHEPQTPKSVVSRPLPLSPSKATSAILMIQTIPSLEAKSKASSIETRKPQNPTTMAQDGGVTSPASVKSAKAMWERSAITEAASGIRRVPSPIKLPTQDDENAAMVSAGLRSSSPVKSLRSAGSGQSNTKSTNPMPILVSPAKSEAPRSPAGRLPMSPFPTASEASEQLTRFFNDRGPVQEYTTDTTSILMARPNNGPNIRTISASLYLLSSDGRKTRVSAHQERVLFEQNMYLCFHTFSNPSGKKTNETYHWIGDDVAPSSVTSVAAFVQKEAKSMGSKLIKISQGKEVPELFQALGGIIIIRRGSANKYDSLAPHIVCGRQFFGQIAFDEMDYAPSSLCSGFPYLISTQSGKSYLWKGKGCGIDELSCARLIGMDFGLTGEVVEVEHGNEPPTFLQIFGNGATIPKSADHWRMKSNYSKYCGRLFCADKAAREQIYEITPFTQTDLDHTKIYILDAFFEIYIVVGSQAQHQYSAFQNALVFVQEYAILAAGMEDRPFVPVSTVVIEGIPRDMKAVFRKWREGLSPTVMVEKQPISRGLRRGMSLRVLPLAVAVEATRR